MKTRDGRSRPGRNMQTKTVTKVVTLVEYLRMVGVCKPSDVWCSTTCNK